MTLILLNVSALDKSHTICGDYTYYAPSNISPDEAIKTAIQRAKINALAEKFGTLISQNNLTIVKNENGQSSIDFTALGGSEVKGEWIEDTKTPETKISYEKQMLVVAVKVCGKAREIKNAKVNFSAKILRNGTEEKFESNTFKDGDDFYLLFKSPVSGFLAVYLIDDKQTAYCLLPYPSNTSGKTSIEHAKEYIFFSPKNALPTEARMVEEYRLTSEKVVEYNQLYIIFSPNEFIKGNDNLTSKVFPRELTFTDFHRWLTNCRNHDDDLQLELKTIEIRKY